MELVEYLKAAIVLAVLLAFVFVFLIEAIVSWKAGSSPPENEARTYIWTGVSALVGSVTAIFLGVDSSASPAASLIPKAMTDPDTWRFIYAATYTFVGFSSGIVWLMRAGSATRLLKNSATTFLGIALPVAATFFA